MKLRLVKSSSAEPVPSEARNLDVHCGFCAQHTAKYASLEALFRLASEAFYFAGSFPIFQDILIQTQ